MSNRFKTLATECAQLIGFDKPQVDEDFYALLIDGIRVLIEPTEVGTDSESMFFCSHIGELQEHNRKLVTDFILEKNADTEFSGAASIGVLPEKNTIAVFQLLPKSINSAQLMIRELNLFIDVAERFEREIVQLNEQVISTTKSSHEHFMSV